MAKEKKPQKNPQKKEKKSKNTKKKKKKKKKKKQPVFGASGLATTEMDRTHAVKIIHSSPALQPC